VFINYRREQAHEKMSEDYNTFLWILVERIFEKFVALFAIYAQFLYRSKDADSIIVFFSPTPAPMDQVNYIDVTINHSLLLESASADSPRVCVSRRIPSQIPYMLLGAD
jgi:hypothetical protein